MKKEFVPYESALELKQLGFDEMCIGAYFHPNLSEMKYPQYFYSNTGLMMGEDACTAPLYQQAFRWFREKYGFDITIQHNKKYVAIAYLSVKNFSIDEYSTYEEAELACLQKLIEIVQQQNEESKD